MGTVKENHAMPGAWWGSGVNRKGFHLFISYSFFTVYSALHRGDKQSPELGMEFSKHLQFGVRGSQDNTCSLYKMKKEVPRDNYGK